MSNLIKKDIRYLGKDFAQFRQNLITFAKQYFPGTYQDFNESSPGMMFIEMSSYIGDVLSYYTDHSFRESILTGAAENANVLQLSQLFGYKPKLNSPAHCLIDVYHLVPAIGTGDGARPDYRFALSIKDGMKVSTESGVTFRTTTSIDFNDDPDISVYEIDASGNVTYYLLKKQVPVISGEEVQRDFSFGDPKQYDKILLPEEDVLEILSVESTTGYSWSEVDYLAQDTIMEDIANVPFNDPELSQFRSTVPYILKLKRTPRRFVTRVRDDLRIELQFGSGISSDADEEIIPNPRNVGTGLNMLKRTTTSNIDPSNFLATSTYGVRFNIKYTIGGGVTENVGVNTIVNVDEVEYLNPDSTVNLDDTQASLAINNPEAAVGGKSRDDLENIRQNAMASFAAQGRAITREDYIARCYAMPGRFGSVAKAYIVGDTQQNTNDIDYPRETINNPLALNLYVLAYDENGNLTQANEALQENLRSYLSQFRMLTDAINVKSAYIVNFKIEFEIITTPSSNSNEVLIRCVERLKTLLHNDRMQINGSISISGMFAELDRVQGVQTVTNVELINVNGGNHSDVVYDMDIATKNNIVYPSLDPCIFELKYPNQDIKGRVIRG